MAANDVKHDQNSDKSSGSASAKGWFGEKGKDRTTPLVVHVPVDGKMTAVYTRDE